MDIFVNLLEGKRRVPRVNPQDTAGSPRTSEPKCEAPCRSRSWFTAKARGRPSAWTRAPLRSGSQAPTPLISQPPTTQVTLVNLEGERHTYNIKPDETVRNLKSRVHCREDVAVGHQRLVWRDKLLKDDQLLSSYGLGAGCIIYLTSLLNAG